MSLSILGPLLGARFPAVQELLENDEAYDGLIESLDDAEHR